MSAVATETTPVQTPRQQLIAKVVLVGLSLYVAALFFMVFDQVFNWGFFPPELTKELTVKVGRLTDSSLSPAAHQALVDDIISNNSFSVPVLLDAIEKDKPAGVRGPATECLQAIAAKYWNVDLKPMGSDPVQLRQWYADFQQKENEAAAKSAAN